MKEKDKRKIIEEMSKVALVVGVLFFIMGLACLLIISGLDPDTLDEGRRSAYREMMVVGFGLMIFGGFLGIIGWIGYSSSKSTFQFSEQPQKFCIFCGKPISSKAVFCGYCGKCQE